MTAPATPASPPRWTARHTGWALSGGLGTAAWIVLIAWDRSPWAQLLAHHGAEDLAPDVAASVFVGAWALMIAAMMLPTTAPLVSAFGRVVRGRADRRRLLAALLAGYGSVWMVAGLVAYAGDLALHVADDQWGIVGDRGWLLVALAVGAAGAYQYASSKERCLTACRTPAGVIISSWRGHAPAAEAYRIGTSHGFTCVGCCWALMLIMFAIGAGNLGWLLALTAIMTVEKTASWGAAITRPLGVGLLALAAVIVAVQL